MFTDVAHRRQRMRRARRRRPSVEQIAEDAAFVDLLAGLAHRMVAFEFKYSDGAAPIRPIHSKENHGMQDNSATAVSLTSNLDVLDAMMDLMRSGIGRGALTINAPERCGARSSGASWTESIPLNGESP